MKSPALRTAGNIAAQRQKSIRSTKKDSMIPFYFEANLEYSRSEWNENKKGIVMAADEDEAWSKVVSRYENTGGSPVVYVTIFPTIGLPDD